MGIRVHLRKRSRGFLEPLEHRLLLLSLLDLVFFSLSCSTILQFYYDLCPWGEAVLSSFPGQAPQMHPQGSPSTLQAGPALSLFTPIVYMKTSFIHQHISSQVQALPAKPSTPDS